MQIIHSSLRLALWAGLLLAAAAAWGAEEARTPPAADAIAFGTDLPAAVARAEADNQPVIVFFTATWCQWCRRMELSTFPDEAVTRLAGKFVWVKIDIDQNQELAALWGVGGTPVVAVLNKYGDVLEMANGYQTPSALAKLLTSNAERASQPGSAGSAKAIVERLKKSLAPDASADPAALSQSVKEAVQSLARAGSADRTRLLDGLKAQGPRVWVELRGLMEDAQLAVRAAAATALEHACASGLPFDPFASAAVRQDQLSQWDKFLAGRLPPRATSQPSPLPTTQPARP